MGTTSEPVYGGYQCRCYCLKCNAWHFCWITFNTPVDENSCCRRPD